MNMVGKNIEIVRSGVVLLDESSAGYPFSDISDIFK